MIIYGNGLLKPDSLCKETLVVAFFFSEPLSPKYMESKFLYLYACVLPLLFCTQGNIQTKRCHLGLGLGIIFRWFLQLWGRVLQGVWAEETIWWHSHFLWSTTNPEQLDLGAQRTQLDEELSWSWSGRDQMNHIKCDHYGAEHDS